MYAKLHNSGNMPYAYVPPKIRSDQWAFCEHYLHFAFFAPLHGSSIELHVHKNTHAKTYICTYTSGFLGRSDLNRTWIALRIARHRSSRALFTTGKQLAQK